MRSEWASSGIFIWPSLLHRKEKNALLPLQRQAKQESTCPLEKTSNYRKSVRMCDQAVAEQRVLSHKVHRVNNDANVQSMGHLQKGNRKPNHQSESSMSTRAPKPSYLHAPKRSPNTCSNVSTHHNDITGVRPHKATNNPRKEERELSDARLRARYASLQRDNNPDRNYRGAGARRLRSATTRSLEANGSMQINDGHVKLGA